jgi:ABC-type nitrate/sulfonate/bicarbonate transport system ATPase subunit
MADEALIVAERLTKRFSAAAVPAIDGLTARIEPGRVTGLVGPDAAGKTTLLRLFAGLLLPSDGLLTVSPATRRRGGSGPCVCTRCIVSNDVGPRNGTCPVRHSYRITPSA